MFIFYFNAAKALDLPFKHGKKAKLVLDDIMPHKSKRCIATYCNKRPVASQIQVGFLWISMDLFHQHILVSHSWSSRGAWFGTFPSRSSATKSWRTNPKTSSNHGKGSKPSEMSPSWTLCVSGHEKEAPEPRQLWFKLHKKNQADTFRTSKSTPLQRIIPNTYPLENVQNPKKSPVRHHSWLTRLHRQIRPWIFLGLLGSLTPFFSLVGRFLAFFGLAWQLELQGHLWLVRPMDCL